MSHGETFEPDLEEMLGDVCDAVPRFRTGQFAAIEAAIDGGKMLALARAKCGHGDWIPWIERAGLTRPTANRWIRLAELGLTAEEVQALGGIGAALNAARTPKKAAEVQGE